MPRPGLVCHYTAALSSTGRHADCELMAYLCMVLRPLGARYDEAAGQPLAVRSGLRRAHQASQVCCRQPAALHQCRCSERVLHLSCSTKGDMNALHEYCRFAEPANLGHAGYDCAPRCACGLAALNGVLKAIQIPFVEGIHNHKAAEPSLNAQNEPPGCQVQEALGLIHVSQTVRGNRQQGSHVGRERKDSLMMLPAPIQLAALAAQLSNDLCHLRQAGSGVMSQAAG